MSSARFEYLLRLGDNALILSQRLGEWCGKGPALEEDMALTNTALDLLGQARAVQATQARVRDLGLAGETGKTNVLDGKRLQRPNRINPIR